VSDVPRAGYRTGRPIRFAPCPQTLRNTLLSARDLLATGGPFILLAVGLLAIAYWLLDPAPPTVWSSPPVRNRATTPSSKRYVEALREFGIRVELRNTQGAAENLKLLEIRVGRRHRLRARRRR
jgi:hypothetical protein